MRQRPRGSAHINAEALPDGVCPRASVGALGKAVAAGGGQGGGVCRPLARQPSAPGVVLAVHAGYSSARFAAESSLCGAAQRSPQKLAPAGVLKQQCRLAHHHQQGLGAGHSHIEALGVAPARGRAAGGGALLFRQLATRNGSKARMGLLPAALHSLAALPALPTAAAGTDQKPKWTSPPAGPPSAAAGRAGGSDSGRLSTVEMKMMRSSCGRQGREGCVEKENAK